MLQKSESAEFKFLGESYVHRYSKADLHEFTPKDKPSLDKWTDMVTINNYPKIKSGEELAKSANAVLETYKDHGAMIVKTDSVPKTSTREAEHLVVVLFPQPDFIEASFTRFLIKDGHGHSLIYSHRVYGKKAGDAMSLWLKSNGEKTEKALMAVSSLPKPK